MDSVFVLVQTNKYQHFKKATHKICTRILQILIPPKWEHYHVYTESGLQLYPDIGKTIIWSRSCIKSWHLWPMSMYHPLQKVARGVQLHVLTGLRNGPVFLHQDLSICSTCLWKARNVIIHFCPIMTLLMLNLPLLSFLPSSTQYFCISATQLFARNSWKTLLYKPRK